MASSKIYVRAITGYYQKLRQKITWVLMLLFIALPWLNYQQRQAILFDIEHQQFHLFSTTLWPQDFTILALIFIIAAFALFFITTFLGRVWCGYLCPQTVWSAIFQWWEEKLEGPANKRRAQDNKRYSSSLWFKKTVKHCIWLLIAFFTAVSFVGYFVPVRQLISQSITFNLSNGPLFWIVFFTLCTYLNAGWLRATVCLHMCPYARFQSAMFDKDTYIVAYHNDRAEPRGPRSRKQDPKQLGLGDCIDCNLCVQVCPTGIDIRDGLQYECINCGACIDACDNTMAKMGYPKRLISYTTEHQLTGKKSNILRPKLLAYGGVLSAMTVAFLFSLNTIKPMEFDVLRDRNQLFRETNLGQIANTYTLKVSNKSQHIAQYQLTVDSQTPLAWQGKRTVILQPQEIANIPITLTVEPKQITQSLWPITFKIATENQQTSTVESRFIAKLN